MAGFKTLNLVQGTQEWLDSRRNHVTATEVAHVKSGFTSLYKLINQKRGIIPVEDISSLPPVVEGKRFEPLIRKEVVRLLPQLLAEGETDLPQPVLESQEEPFFMASLDGYSSSLNLVLEIKNVFSKVRQNYEEMIQKGLNASTPLKYGYYYQVQWQLFITGSPMALLAFHWSPNGTTFHPENIRVLKVSRDEEAISQLQAIAYEIKDILVNNKEVPPGPNDVVFLDSGKLQNVAPLLEEYRFVDTAYKQCLETLNTLKTKRSSLTDEISQELLSGDTNKVQGVGFSLARIERKGSFNVEKMIEDGIISQETADKYRKGSSFSTKLTIS